MAKQSFKCADVYSTFFNPGEVTEIRAFGLARNSNVWEGFASGAGIVYGYFDNAESFGSAAESLDKALAGGIYFTLNPVNPDLLSRAANRLKASGQKTVTTSDREIQAIRWLPVDLDPIRPTGISATAGELKAAMSLRNKIVKWMIEDRGFEHCIAAGSGNGAHAVFRLHEDMPNCPAAVQVVKGSLEVLASRFDTEKVEVDQIVFNPSRIWKVYGTTARKGDHTEQRPHRKSRIQKVK